MVDSFGTLSVPFATVKNIGLALSAT